MKGPEERSDDLAGRGDPAGFAGRGERSRDPSPGRVAVPTMWDLYFHGEHGAVRVYLLSKLFLGMLALDAWMLMIGHAGRYGAGEFNVAHFRWLDQLQPIPTPGLYLGVLLLTGLVSLWLMLAGARTLPMLVLFGLYTFSWAMSMLDSYQHHYFVSLVLLCMAFFPQASAQEVEDSGGRLMRSGFGFALLGVLTAIVYIYTAVAKMDPTWIDGHTIQSIPSARAGFADMAAYAARWGIEGADFWSLFATFVIPQEILMGVAYLAAVKRDTAPHWAIRLLCVLGILLVIMLHVGAEHMGLEIGWFSYYMLAMGTCFLLPLGFVALLAKLVTLPALGCQKLVGMWEAEPAGPGLKLALSVAGAGMLAGVGHMLDLPGALPATVIAGAILVGYTLLSGTRADLADPRRHILASTIAAMVMWAAIAASPARWDFYRYVGGDAYRRGMPEAALSAYLKGERYAPEGETRIEKIEKIKRELGRN